MMIPSFEIDHIAMLPGVYVSQTFKEGRSVVTTYDIRLCKPNTRAMTPACAHTLEHLLAMYFRNESELKDRVIYVGPMGCLTGFYLILSGEPADITDEVLKAMKWIRDYDGDYGADATRCGNWRLHSLPEAKGEARRFIENMQSRTIAVVATEGERPLAERVLGAGCRIIVTGVGGTNVIRELQGIDRDTPILNIGYAGSVDIPIGTEVRVGKVHLQHECDYDEPFFDLGGDVECVTSCDFHVGRPGCVCDMELAFICAMGFRNVTAVKIVSDRCNYNEYKSNTECLRK